jgi:hypothetical protein
MRAVVTNVVGMCSMDVALVMRDVKKRRRTREAVGWNWTSRKGGQRIMCWKVHVV